MVQTKNKMEGTNRLNRSTRLRGIKFGGEEIIQGVKLPGNVFSITFSFAIKHV